ncbi:MAG: hypothetical protein EP151_11550 [Phascolarctobacterium sp.]|nr:hypothetical protein [Phascolarctobacterium sp.]
MTRKILAIIAAAICTLAITATAFAAEFINADQARSIAAQWVPAGSTHLVTKDESHKYAAYYEVKFYDNATNTEYEVEVLKNGGAVKEFKMDAQTVLGSPRVVLSAADVQDLVRKEFPNATFTKVKLDSDDGLYEYELKFYTPELRGEMKFNPENGALMEKNLNTKFAEPSQKYPHLSDAGPFSAFILLSAGPAQPRSNRSRAELLPYPHPAWEHVSAAFPALPTFSWQSPAAYKYRSLRLRPSAPLHSHGSAPQPTLRQNSVPALRRCPSPPNKPSTPAWF